MNCKSQFVNKQHHEQLTDRMHALVKALYETMDNRLTIVQSIVISDPSDPTETQRSPLHPGAAPTNAEGPESDFNLNKEPVQYLSL